nr:polyprenyl synthetase family protein [Burkholderiaceae bacterium]
LRVPSPLERFASAMGLAFQIVDDVLDVEGCEQALGKTAGKDALNDKPTYVSLMGIGQARARACALHEEALAALSSMPAGATQRLRELADFILLRNH